MQHNEDIDEAPIAGEPVGIEPAVDSEPEEAPGETESDVESDPDPVEESSPAAPRAQARSSSGRDKSPSKFPLFAAVLLFALVAQPLAAGALVMLGNAGAIDLAASPTGALPILAGVFGVELLALAFAIGLAGFTFGRVFAALLALAASSGMAMLAYVGLGCWLSGNCL